MDQLYGDIFHEQKDATLFLDSSSCDDIGDGVQSGQFVRVISQSNHIFVEVGYYSTCYKSSSHHLNADAKKQTEK